MLDTILHVEEDTMTKNPSALEQVQKLQQQMMELSDQAKEEALAQADAAIATLNALGFQYRLVNGSEVTRAKTAKTTQKREKKEGAVCPTCDFATNPPHDSRKHKRQGEKKRPFTQEELEELGLERV